MNCPPVGTAAVPGVLDDRPLRGWLHNPSAAGLWASMEGLTPPMFHVKRCQNVRRPVAPPTPDREAARPPWPPRGGPTPIRRSASDHPCVSRDAEALRTGSPAARAVPSEQLPWCGCNGRRRNHLSGAGPDLASPLGVDEVCSRYLTRVPLPRQGDSAVLPSLAHPPRHRAAPRLTSSGRRPFRSTPRETVRRSATHAVTDDRGLHVTRRWEPPLRGPDAVGPGGRALGSSRCRPSSGTPGRRPTQRHRPESAVAQGCSRGEPVMRGRSQGLACPRPSPSRWGPRGVVHSEAPGIPALRAATPDHEADSFARPPMRGPLGDPLPAPDRRWSRPGAAVPIARPPAVCPRRSVPGCRPRATRASAVRPRQPDPGRAVRRPTLLADSPPGVSPRPPILSAPAVEGLFARYLSSATRPPWSVPRPLRFGELALGGPPPATRPR